MELSIRKATMADVDALADLAAATFPDACPPQLRSEEIAAFIDENLSVPAFEQYLTGKNFVVHVAEAESGDLLAYTLTDLDAPVPEGAVEPAGYVSKFYVSKVARGSGVSARLMQTVLDEIRAAGLAGAHLGTSVDNVRANAFYKKSGFEVIGTREFAVGGATCTDNVWALEF